MFDAHYTPADKEFWSGRIDDHNDPDAFRWHQVIKLIHLNNIRNLILDEDTLHICFLGFCCDEGVRRNMGRPGAKNGPESIRKEMANWPVNFLPQAKIYDAGNINCLGHDLESAQAALAIAVEKIKTAGFFPILLGGGHEIALGHFKGLVNHLDKTEKAPKAPAIINFDAHLDLRPYNQGGSSGTMFHQIYDQCKAESRDYAYYCLGPQTYANTKSLFKRADAMGARYMPAKDITPARYPNILTELYNYISDHQEVYITLCTDVLSAAHAPGVSALQPFGLDPEVVLTLIKQIILTRKVCSIDIAEVSPRFDSDNRTAKLVAVFIYAIINTLIEAQEH
ncbi:formimidoylglutamase [Marinilabiliaceae bacterium JC017]|nr:formimidoylglutamase [Marinilabiliaceae bacterium JC017]